MAEPVAKKRRFQNLDQTEIKRLISNRVSDNTRRGTKYSVDILRTYLREKENVEHDDSQSDSGQADPVINDVYFDTFSVIRLNQVLSKFWVEMRTVNGELYSYKSLQTIRNDIRRYLMELSSTTSTSTDSEHEHDEESETPTCNFDLFFERDKNQVINIVHDRAFNQSNIHYNSMLVEIKRKGNDDHYPEITADDLKKLFSYFEDTMDTPVGLQDKVFFDYMLHFGRRGRENLYGLNVSALSIENDSTGCRYVVKSSDGRMYEISGKLILS